MQPIIAPSIRSIAYNPVNSAGPFVVPWPTFSASGAELEVLLNGVELAGWTFAGEQVDGFYGAPFTWVNGTVTLAAPVTGAVTIYSRIVPERQTQFAEGRGVPPRDMNAAFNYLTAVAQEHRRDLDIEASVRSVADAVLQDNVDGVLASVADSVTQSAANASSANAAMRNVAARQLPDAAVAPTVDEFGVPVAQGARYFNTAKQRLFQRVGTIWRAVEKVWHVVASPPTASLGEDGDYAISSSGGTTWGPKAAGAWPAGLVIAGGDIRADGTTPFTGPIQSTVPALAPASTSMTLYKAVVPGIINSAGGDDTQQFSIGVTSGKWTQGPTGHANYTDQVFGIGWNMAPSFAPLDPTKPSTSFRIESKFAQGAANSVFGSEIHLSHYPIGGAEKRYFSAFCPHTDAGAHESAVVLSSRQIVLQDYGNAAVVTYDFGAAKRITFDTGMEQFFTVNNKPVARQADATGTTSVALPYVDYSGSIAVVAPVTGPTTAGMLAGISSGLIVQSSGASGDVLNLRAPHATSGSMTFSCGSNQSASAAIAVVANGTTTFTFTAGAVTAADLNRTITGANVPANTVITELTTPTSAKASNVLPNTVTSITMSARSRKTAAFGVDVQGNLVISQSTTAGGALYADVRGNTGGLIVRDSDNGSATFFQVGYGAVVAHRPFKPGTYTLTTLPSAATFAGHLIWVSNATGGAKLCVSDGSNWNVLSTSGPVS